MKTALTIDGNYLLMKDVFILHYMKSLYVDLEKLLLNDINKLMKMYPFDKVFFVSDSKDGYWRKEMFETYKSSRKKDDSIDWAWVFEKYDELKEIISNNPKIEQIEINKCEGDDVIAHIVNNNNKLNYSNVVVASDSDLHQLLRFDIYNDYINMIYNFKYSDEKLYLPENHNIFMQHKDQGQMSIFDMNDDDEYMMFINELKNKTKASEINIEKLLFCKLISGDSKDNIPSVYIKGKRGIGKKGSENIYEQYKKLDSSKIDFDSTEFVDKVIDVIIFNKKIDIDDIETSNLIRKNIERNKTLTILTDRYLPTNILTEMKSHIIF